MKDPQAARGKICAGERQRRTLGPSRACFALEAAVLCALAMCCAAVPASASCSAPKNALEAENCLPGNPKSDWYVDGAGAASIQGFASDMSVSTGQTISFKVATNAAAYRIDVYRLGYYQGNGARLEASIAPSATLPQAQPACLQDSSTGLTDCGNWGVSASWAVPASAVSGVYLAKLVRPDTGEASPILFVVRNDASHSDILVQTCDPTWEAYNDYGGSSLYTGPTIRAFKVSYNRPFNVPNPPTWIFSAEYPMLRWLEENGYDLSYMAGVDTDRYGGLIKQHKIFLAMGHDEYWSGGQRANVEAALAAGVNLAFFTGNEIFWKTRWEASIDGTNTAYRTLVCYKETLVNQVIDPNDPPTWTGQWRDASFSPPGDGGRPENALTGTIFAVNSYRNDPMTVPQADGRMRFWRNTSIASLAPGQTATLPAGVLGYEWDIDADNGFRPAGLIALSTTTINVPTLLLRDDSFGTGDATHHLTMYRAASGALVFGAGTVQWSWGLDSNHTNAGTPTDPNMQQATVNLLADMGAQPATLQAGLVPAAASTDSAAPSSAITSPASGAVVRAGSAVTISGTATDSGGGVVGAVEVSLDGGKSWHPANGRENWTYTGILGSTGTFTVRSRAADDSGNLEIPSSGVTVTSGPPNCPCTIWPSTASPVIPDAGAYPAVELGMKLTAESDGYITGIRFYRSAANTGATVGDLWSSSGTLLASAPFPVSGEGSSGWQQVNFSTPVAVTANTVYVASYHTMGHFAADNNFFSKAGVDRSPLHALGGSGLANGVYAFADASAFPTQTYNAQNYWVDVVFSYQGGLNPPLTLATSLLPAGIQSAAYTANLVAVDGTAPYTWSLQSGSLPGGLTLSSSGQISGTPTATGVSAFTVRVTDSASQTATRLLSITVGPPGSGGMSITVTPATSGLLPGSAQALTASVLNDPANGGVTWSVAASDGTSCSPAACGSVSPTLTASGEPSIYTVPSSVPAGGSVLIRATSVTDSTKSASASISLSGGVNDSELSGDYAFRFSGITGSSAGSSPFAAVGRFTADGSGNITNGDLDTNGVGSGSAAAAQAFTGQYAIGADERGVMTLSLAGGSVRLAFAMQADGGAKFIKFDAAGGLGTIGSGNMEKADTTAYSTAAVQGDYAFGFAGMDNSNTRAAMAGRFTANGTGTIANAAGDVNAYGLESAMSFSSASYAVWDASTGRGKMNFAFQFGGGSANLNFVFYVVNRGELFVMESDSVSSATPLLNGAVQRQQTPPGGFSNASLSGGMVIYLTGLSTCANAPLPVPRAFAGLLTFDGNGALGLTFDENFCGTGNSGTGLAGPYNVESSGRVPLAVGNGAVGYLASAGQMFIVGQDSTVLFGFGEAQATGAVTNATVTGAYTGYATDVSSFDVAPFSGEFNADGASPTGTLTGTEDVGLPSGPNSGAALSASYSVSSSPVNGRGMITLNSGSGGSAAAYVISASKFVAVPLNDPNPAVWMFDPPSAAPRSGAHRKGKHEGRRSGGSPKRVRAVSPAQEPDISARESGGDETRDQRSAPEKAQ